MQDTGAFAKSRVVMRRAAEECGVLVIRCGFADCLRHRICDAPEASGVFVASAETAARAARRPAGSAT